MAEAPSRPSRGRTILLVASLCLNLLLIALIVVGLSRAVQGGFIAQPGGQLAPGQIARGLSPEGQAKVRGIIAEHRDAIREARQGARRARLSAFRIFASPDYTPDAFTTALEQVRAADSRLEEEAILMLKDTINNLTPDERKTIVTRVRTGANRPWWRRWFIRAAAQPAQ
jgi:uncharacterized membrane protein